MTPDAARPANDDQSPTELYKAFIDAMAEGSKYCARSAWLLNPAWLNRFKGEEAEFVNALSPSHRETLARMLLGAVRSGFHDALVVITDQNLRLSKDGIRLAHQPTGCTMFFDFVARADGADWPTTMKDSDPTN